MEKTEIFMPPSAKLLRFTKIQIFFGHLLLLPFCTFIALLMRYLGGYVIENKAELRKKFREEIAGKRPLIICANHLTFIDSTIIIWALAPNWWYFFNYKSLSWNLPAGDVFKKKIYFRIVAYLGKCIFIHRDGTKEHKEEVLSLAHLLIKRGHVLTIFPEGRRSRSGFFDTDHITFGTGKIITGLDECNVLCVYIRGDKQQGYSNYPPRNSKFRPLMRLIKVKGETDNHRGYLSVSTQIAQNIKELEDEYFKIDSVQSPS